MYTILVVDDNKTNLQMVRSILGETYNVLSALSGEMALRYAEKKDIDLILLDLLMPDMDGRETLHALRCIPTCATVPVIFLTASSEQATEVECLRLGACDFILKPFAPEVLRTRIERVLELEAYRKDLHGQLMEKTSELEAVVLQAITTIANTLDAKDKYTKGHSVRVANYAAAIARKKSWPKEACQALHRVALLHDVGKIGIPDAVLNKKERLTSEEFDQIKRHTVIGTEILKDIKSLRELVIGAGFHHERYDGQGYPQGLKGCEIPEIARIICVADAYDAMTSHRCYRPSLEPRVAQERLKEEAGKQFDPEIVALFLTMLDQGELEAVCCERS